MRRTINDLIRSATVGGWRTARRVTGAAVLATGVSVAVPPLTTAHADVPAPITYTDPATPANVTVPAGVCGITFDVIGGQGGSPLGLWPGGLGGRVVAKLTVSPGDIYSVRVGAAGGTVTGGVSGGLTSGGTGGNGGSAAKGGGGGGASSVTIIHPTEAITPAIVAAGGGGGAQYSGSGGSPTNGSPGGDGGADDGTGRDGSDQVGGATGGGGGTQSAGGAAGSRHPLASTGYAATPGSYRTGGHGSYSNDGGAAGGGGGGGGGGFYGGGGGGTWYDESTLDDNAAGGGGGSNYAPGNAIVNGVAPDTGSGSVTATFHGCAGPPEQPTALTSSVDNGTYHVTFTPGADGGSAIIRYEYSLDNGATWATLTTSAAPNDRLTGPVGELTAGDYDIKVRGVNTYGDGTASAAHTINISTAPDLPTGLSTVPGDDSIDVTFTPPVNDGNSPITRYEVSTDGGASWATIVTSSLPNGNRTGSVAARNGSSYTVRVRAVNAYGESVGSDPEYVQLPPGRPDPPGTPVATPRNGEILLTFTPPADDGGDPVTSYEVSTDDGVNWGYLTITNYGQNSVSGLAEYLANGVSYTFRVRAGNSVGTSDPSGSVVSVPQAVAPDAPTNLTADRADQALLLAFQPPYNNGGLAITGYEVSTDDGVNWAPLVTSVRAFDGKTIGTVGNLTNGTDYIVRVRAVNGIGPGAASMEMLGSPGARPSQPTDVVMVAGDQSVQITFTPPANDGGYPITEYRWQHGSSMPVVLATSAGPNGTRVGTITGLTNGSTYWLRIFAVNSVGWSDQMSQQPIKPAGGPGAPTGLSATAGDEQVTLTFTAPVADGGDAITGYQVSTDDGTNYTDAPTSAGPNGTLTMTVTGLTNGQLYPFRVRAKNSVTTGAGSDGTAATPAAAPGVVGLVLSPGNQRMLLTITPPIDDGGSPVTKYQVRTGQGTWVDLSTTAGPNGTLTGIVTGLTNGQPVTIHVRAVNGIGDGAELDQTATPNPVAPDAPVGVTGQPGNGQVTLTITPPVDDGGSPVTKYQVRTGHGPWVDLPTTAGPNGTRVGSVTGLTNGVMYTFQVRAVNAAGDGTPGDPTTATPAPVPPDAPGTPSAVPGNATATVTFTPPAQTGGASIIRYEYSTDGTTWTTLTTTAGTGSARVGTVSGLVNGTLYGLRVRAVTSAGEGASTAPVPVVPGTPLAPRQVVATAGVSSVAVTWQPPTDNGVTVTRYVATASPGPATCTANAPDTGCLLGGVAGTSYTVTVVAYAGVLTSAPSDPSGAAVPDAPPVADEPPPTTLTLTTDQGEISTADPGETITVIGTGFAPFSTARITLYSEPIVLASVVTDIHGAFSQAVTVPSNLAAGKHTFIASGVDALGNAHAMKLEVTVEGAGGLATTGVSAVPGLASVVTGVLLVLIGRRRVSR